MLPYFKIIRPINLLLIAVLLLSIKIGFLLPSGVAQSLSLFQYSILTLATVFIAAGGYVINDLYDVAIDKINKPKESIIGSSISEKTGNYLYLFFTVVGVLLGFYIANSIGKPGMAAVFILVAALLYLYASSLSKILLVGTVLISVLVGFTLVLPIIFDIFPAVDTDQMEAQVKISKLLLYYAGFAFILNFIRELIKDIQDIDGDKMGERKTVPIAIGRKRTRNIVLGFAIIITISLLYYVYKELYIAKLVSTYFIFLIVAPLGFFILKGWDAASKKEFKLLSILLKISMLTGSVSIIFQNQFL